MHEKVCLGDCLLLERNTRKLFLASLETLLGLVCFCCLLLGSFLASLEIFF